MAADDPVRRSYDLYFEDKISGRESWDLTFVFYAVEGSGDYRDIEVGYVTVDPADGSNIWTDDSSGKQAILIEKMSPNPVADAINTQMTKATKGSFEDR